MPLPEMSRVAFVTGWIKVLSLVSYGVLTNIIIYYYYYL